MEKFSFTLLTLLVFCISCASTKQSTKIDKLIGKYDWVKTEGGFMGKTQTPESTGKTKQLEISANEIVFYTNNIESKRSSYSITDSVDYRSNPVEIIELENDKTFWSKMKGDTLFLSEPYADGFQFTYIKNQ